MFAALVPKLGGLFAQQATQVITAGLLTGIVGGSVGVATGVIPVVDQPAQHATALYECPGSGRIVTSVAPNQEVLVTRRSADGGWLEIYVGRPGVERAWAPAAALNLEAAPDTLPIGDCEPEVTPGPTVEPQSSAPSAAPSTEPSGSAEPSQGPSPSPSPVPSATPQPSMTPTPTVESTPSPTPYTGPTLSELTLAEVPEDPYNPGQYPVYPPGCGDPYEFRIFVSFTVMATDPDGIATVTLYYQPLGGSVFSTPMEDEGGGLYYGAFNTGSDWSNGEIDYWVKAVDGVGTESTELHGDSSHKLILTYCLD